MVKREIINYSDSLTDFQGTICWDDAVSGEKPGVLVVHTIRGCTDFEIEKAVELAKLGYVGFAVDMYGDGRNSNDSDEARVWMDELNNDRKLLQTRISLALETLKNNEQVHESKTAAIGFCFGGKCVLDLARSGADFGGAVSFHGVYDKPQFENEEQIKPSILVLHGWDDPLNQPVATVALAEELTKRKADWQILSFGQTGHSFTNPTANMPERGLIYNETSNRRAWSAMEKFFAEIF